MTDDPDTQMPFMEHPPIPADDLRAKSDALLLACGWLRHDMTWEWWKPHGGESVGDDPKNRPHPYANAQDAIDLTEAMGLKVLDSHVGPDGTYIYWLRTPEREKICGKRFAPTIAEAISAAIAEAVKE